MWLFLWILVGYSSPATHPRISHKERLYIEESIAAQGHKDEVHQILFRVQLNRGYPSFLSLHIERLGVTDNELYTAPANSYYYYNVLVTRMPHHGFTYSHLLLFGLSLWLTFVTTGASIPS